MTTNKHHAHRSSANLRWLGRITTLLLAIVAIAPLHAAPSRDAAHWVPTWTASPQPRWDGDFALPTNLPEQLWNQTVRQSLRVSVGGKRVRVMLSNEYGTKPLLIGAAHLALAGEGAAINGGSDRALTFGGQTTVTIPPGAPAISDPVELDVAPLGRVTVSLFLPEPTPPATFHWDARQATQIVAGNQVAAGNFKADSTLSTRLFLSSVMIDAPDDARTVVAFGDSITDGAMSTMNTDHRWPDFLAARLAKDHVAVLNAGISGARVLRDKMGVNALARFERDVLSQPNLKSVIVLMGINDLSWNAMVFAPHDTPVQAFELIAGYRQLIARAHARGVRILGATLTPFEGAMQDTPMRGYYSADKERVRQAVNRWIRDSGEFDAMVDFDVVMRDPAHAARVLAAYDSGDHLHPGDAGYKAMADVIDMRTLFGSD